MLSPLIIQGPKLHPSNAHGNGISSRHSGAPAGRFCLFQDEFWPQGNHPHGPHLFIFPWAHHIILFFQSLFFPFQRSIPSKLGPHPFPSAHIPLKEEFHLSLIPTSEISTPSIMTSVLYQSFSEVLAYVSIISWYSSSVMRTLISWTWVVSKRSIVFSISK